MANFSNRQIATFATLIKQLPQYPPPVIKYDGGRHSDDNYASMHPVVVNFKEKRRHVTSSVCRSTYMTSLCTRSTRRGPRFRGW